MVGRCLLESVLQSLGLGVHIAQQVHTFFNLFSVHHALHRADVRDGELRPKKTLHVHIHDALVQLVELAQTTS